MKSKFTLVRFAYEQEHRNVLFILLSAILTLPQVSLFFHPLAYDQNSAFFPWYYYIGSCFNEGIFPYWNPYQTLGYPFHTDPQTGVWYPITWLFCMDGRFTVANLQLLFILHLFIAGCGMYFFCRQLKCQSTAATVAGISFMWCGFFIGNSQHMGWIIAAAWLPWILLFSERFFTSFDRADGMRTAIVMALIITGGYPMLTVCVGYLVLALVILKVVRNFRKPDWIKSFIVKSILMGILIVLLSAGFISSMVVALPYFSRATGVSLAFCLEGPFSPQSLISLLLPYVTVKNPGFFKTDMSMNNAYMGLFMLPAIVAGLFLHGRQHKLLFFSGCLFLLLSFGEYTPVREFFYHYVPLFNISRFPALFRIMFIFCFIPFGALFMEDMMNQERYLHRYRIILLCMAVLLVALVVHLMFSRQTLDLHTYFVSGFLKASEVTDWKQHAFVQAFSLLLLIFLFFKITGSNICSIKKGLLILVIGDFIMASQLNGPYNVYTGFVKTSELQQFCDRMPKDFPVPVNKAMVNYSDSTGGFSVLWQNKSIYYKKPGWDGFSSSFFKGAQPFYDSCPQVFSRFLRLKENTFFADSVHPAYSFPLPCSLIDPNVTYLPDKDFHKTGSKVSPGKARFTRFLPNEIVVETSNSGTGLLCLMQNYFPGWKATVDGRETDLFKPYHFAMGVLVPPGKHLVAFSYRPKEARIGGILQVTSLILSLGGLFFLFIRKILQKV